MLLNPTSMLPTPLFFLTPNPSHQLPKPSPRTFQFGAVVPHRIPTLEFTRVLQEVVEGRHVELFLCVGSYDTLRGLVCTQGCATPILSLHHVVGSGTRGIVSGEPEGGDGNLD